MSAGDLNGDGKDDIIFLAYNINSPTQIYTLIAYSNGDGTFAAPQQLNVSPAIVGGTLLDLNNDHKTDILSNDEQGNLVALLGNGNGTFQAPVVTSNLPSTIISAINDLNGDGIPDLLLYDNGVNYYVALGDGHGGFTSTGNTVNTGVTAGFVYILGLQAFNKGGEVGLLLLVAEDESENTTNNYLVFVPGNGDGTFGTPQTGATLTGHNPHSDTPVSYAGGSADFFQDGNYEGILVGSTDICCETDLVNVSSSGIASIQTLSSYSSLYSNARPTPNGDPQVSSGVYPLTFGPHQAGFVDGNGMVFTFTSIGQGALTYLPTYFFNFATSSTTPLSSPLQFFGTTPFVTSSVTAQPPLSISNLNIASANTNCCSANVTFTPGQSGAFSGVVSINSNDSASPLNLPVFAYTGTPAITASPATIAFGDVEDGNKSSQQVTVTNTSRSPAYVTQIAFSGTIQATQTNNCTGPITSTCSITVTFTPTVPSQAANETALRNFLRGLPSQAPRTS